MESGRNCPHQRRHFYYNGLRKTLASLLSFICLRVHFRLFGTSPSRGLQNCGQLHEWITDFGPALQLVELASCQKDSAYMGSEQSCDSLSLTLYRKHTCNACLLPFKIKTKQKKQQASKSTKIESNKIVCRFY